MPQKRNSQEPPKVMTWSKALPVLAVAGILDALRMFFEMFWLFGPALAAVYCTAKASGSVAAVTLGLLGTKTTALVCTGAAAVGGAALSELTVPFGVIMAIALGLLGWMLIGGLIFMQGNARIFKVNAGNFFWFSFSLCFSEVPFINTLPILTVTIWKMYAAQIKKEEAELRLYEKEQAEAQQLERDQQIAQIAQFRAAQLAQVEAQEAANEDLYEEEIPDEVYKAA